MRPPTPEETRSYSRLINAAIGESLEFEPTCETPSAVQVERGSIFPMCLCGRTPDSRVDRLIDMQPLVMTTVVDRAGDSRPEYLGLLIYCWLQAMRQCRDASHWRPAIGAWCARIENELRRFELPIATAPAADGPAVLAAAWQALALWIGGVHLRERRWARLSESVFGSLCAFQLPSGAFLRVSRSDDAIAHHLHERVLLHAVASYAAQSNDTLATAASMQAADYHHRENQPLHCAFAPWGLHAFIWRRESRELAESMLAALGHRPPVTSSLTSMLLADSLYCLRLLDRGV